MVSRKASCDDRTKFSQKMPKHSRRQQLYNETRCCRIHWERIVLRTVSTLHKHLNHCTRRHFFTPKLEQNKLQRPRWSLKDHVDVINSVDLWFGIFHAYCVQDAKCYCDIQSSVRCNLVMCPVDKKNLKFQSVHCLSSFRYSLSGWQATG